MIQRVLDSSESSRTDPTVLRALGVVLGDCLARRLDLHWVAWRDGIGTTSALRFRETMVIVFPLDMIIKRRERGETVDVASLFRRLVEMIREMIQSKKHG